jgi:hypothetical protein
VRSIRGARPRVSSEELIWLRRAENILEKRWVCRECGWSGKQFGNHLRQEHGELKYGDVSAAESYKEKYGYNVGTALITPDLHKQLSAHKRDGRSREHLRAVRASPQKMLEARLARKRSVRTEYGLKTAAKPIGPILDRQKVSDWSIAKPRLEGHTDSQICRIVGLSLNSHGPVQQRLRRIGFPMRHGYVVGFWRGKPMTGKNINDLLSDFGLTKREAAKRSGLDWSLIQRAIYKQDRCLALHTRELFLTLRRSLVAEHRHKAATSLGGRSNLLLPSEREELPSKYNALRAEIDIFRGWLREQKERHADVAANHAGEFLCRQARKGEVRLLLFGALEFFSWIEKAYGQVAYNPDAWIPSELAFEFLAHEYNVSNETVRRIAFQEPRTEAEFDDRPGRNLLADVRRIFQARQTMPTCELIMALKVPNSVQWKDLTPQGLAEALRTYGFTIQNLRLGTRVIKGYPRPGIYTTSEAAERLGKHPTTLRRWVRSRKVPAPPRMRSTGMNARVWTDSDIKKVRDVVAKNRKNFHPLQSRNVAE